jgi:hypothetical protein
MYFPHANPNITAAAMIMRTTPMPEDVKDQRVHRELCILLEATAMSRRKNSIEPPVARVRQASDP